MHSVCLSDRFSFSLLIFHKFICLTASSFISFLHSCFPLPLPLPLSFPFIIYSPLLFYSISSLSKQSRISSYSLYPVPLFLSFLCFATSRKKTSIPAILWNNLRETLARRPSKKGVAINISKCTRISILRTESSVAYSSLLAFHFVRSRIASFLWLRIPVSSAFFPDFGKKKSSKITRPFCCFPCKHFIFPTSCRPVQPAPQPPQSHCQRANYEWPQVFRTRRSSGDDNN